MVLLHHLKSWENPGWWGWHIRRLCHYDDIENEEIYYLDSDYDSEDEEGEEDDNVDDPINMEFIN